MAASNFGYGQSSPEDSGTDMDVISFIVRQALARVDTAKMVKVIAVHPGSGSPPGAGTVDVQPLVNQIDGNGYSIAHGTVFGLPYTRMQAGGFAVIADPVVGDVGVVVCCDRDISSVTSNSGAVANPGSRRQHNIADGVYLGAGGAYGKTPKSYIQANSNGGLTIVDAFGNMIQTTSGGITLTPAGGTMNITGNLAVSGNVTDSSGTISLTTHIHSGVTTGGGDTGPPVP